MLWTSPPETAVTVMLYVPDEALVTVGGAVELDEPPDEDPEPHPETVTAAVERTTASRAPQRRRRGTESKSTDANDAPVPTTYHGVRPEGVRRAITSCELAVFALFRNAEMVKVVVAAPEVMLTGFTEKANCEATEVSAVAVRLIVPVKPLNGVSVNAIPEAVAPDLTVVEAWHGVSEKSAWLVETTSMGSVPLEPANVALPE